MYRILTLLFVSLLFGVTRPAQAQRSALILGDWTYSEPLDKEKLDAKAVEMMNTFFSSMWFSFNKDGTYACATMGKEDAGTWTIDPEATRITLVSKDGHTDELRVLDVTADSWHMELSPGKGFKLVHGERKKE